MPQTSPTGSHAPPIEVVKVVHGEGPSTNARTRPAAPSNGGAPRKPISGRLREFFALLGRKLRCAVPCFGRRANARRGAAARPSPAQQQAQRTKHVDDALARAVDYARAGSANAAAQWIGHAFSNATQHVPMSSQSENPHGQREQSANATAMVVARLSRLDTRQLVELLACATARDLNRLATADGAAGPERAVAQKAREEVAARDGRLVRRAQEALANVDALAPHVQASVLATQAYEASEAVRQLEQYRRQCGVGDADADAMQAMRRALSTRIAELAASPAIAVEALADEPLSRLTDALRHLGIGFEIRPALAAEIHRRVADARQAYLDATKEVFGAVFAGIPAFLNALHRMESTRGRLLSIRAALAHDVEDTEDIKRVHRNAIREALEPYDAAALQDMERELGGPPVRALAEAFAQAQIAAQTLAHGEAQLTLATDMETFLDEALVELRHRTGIPTLPLPKPPGPAALELLGEAERRALAKLFGYEITGRQLSLLPGPEHPGPEP